MAFSQVALCLSTGSPVMGVFQTLSAGKAGQLVPGKVVPALRAAAGVGEWRGGEAGADEADAVAAVPATTVANAIDTATVTILRDREPPLIAFLLRRFWTSDWSDVPCQLRRWAVASSPDATSREMPVTTELSGADASDDRLESRHAGPVGDLGAYFEWGSAGALALAATCAGVVVVDVLSFTTTVVIAAS